MNLTIHLAKKEVGDPLSVLTLDPNDAHREIRVEGRVLGDLFVRSKPPRTPTWVDFFRSADEFDPSVFGFTQAISAAFLVIPDDRIFVLTFGYGRSMLNLDKFEDDFGLKVALNAIEQDSVKSIDKQTFDAIAKQSREQASRKVDPKEFGLDVEDDLLRAVVGTPSSRLLGSQLYGKESLHAIGISITLRELSVRLLQFFHLYLKQDYLEKFPWVDNIRAVRDPQERDSLDQELVGRLNADEPGMIWLAAPDIVDWKRVCGFTYAETKRKPVLYDMHLKSFNEVWGEDITLKNLSTRQVGAVNESDWIVESWPVYKCIHAEIPLEGHEYLLSSGKWYRISRDFVEVVDEAYLAIPDYPGNLPAFGHQDEKTEPEYNRIVCEERPDWVCMDRVLVKRGGGRSSIEACDILTSGHDLIHVKRYSGSSDLSHLFAQGYVSGELLATDEIFREELNALVGEPFRIEFERHMPRNVYGIVFAIVSRSEKKLWPPFFSRLNLRNAARRLEGMGFTVSTKKIEVAPELSMLKRYKKTPKPKGG